MIGQNWGPWSVSDRFLLVRESYAIDLLRIHDEQDQAFAAYCARRQGADVNALSHLGRAFRSIELPAFHRLAERRRLSPVPEPLDPEGRSGVYVIRCGERVKIGSAVNVRRRMGELQCANGDRLELLAMLSPKTSTETMWKARFKHLRVRGEWFWFGEQILMHVLDARGLRL